MTQRSKSNNLKKRAVCVQNLPPSFRQSENSAKFPPNRRLFLQSERPAGGFIEEAARHDPPSAGDVGLNMLKRLVHSPRGPGRGFKPTTKKEKRGRERERGNPQVANQLQPLRV